MTLIDRFPTLVSIDYGWKVDELTSISRRGIIDYRRMVISPNVLSDDDIQMISTWLRENDCPGWTRIGCQKKSDTTYIFSVTMDSSD